MKKKVLVLSVMLLLLPFRAYAVHLDADFHLSINSFSRLHDAVFSENYGRSYTGNGKIGLKQAKRLIAAGAKVDAKNDRGQTPLHVAAILGKLDMVRLLLDNGANPNARDQYGLTPLNAALTIGHRSTDRVDAKLTIIKLLISRGAKVNCSTDERVTPLHQAISGCLTGVANCSAYESIAIYLVGKGAAVNAEDREGKSPLMWAIEDPDIAGDPKWNRPCSCIIPYLLKHGANINQRDNDEESPFCAALGSPNSRSLVSVMLLYKPEVLRYKDEVRKWSLENDHANLFAQTLVATDDLNALLFSAVSSGATSIVEQLLKKGADVKSTNSQGRTPLFYAFNKGILEALLQKGCDINMADNDGMTYLHMLADVNEEGLFMIHQNKNSMEALAEYAIAHGADVNRQAKNGCTPMDFAAAMNADYLIDPLVKAGVDVKAVHFRGQTPLHLAASQAAGTDAVTLLLMYGADPNARNEDGYTPLDVASSGRKAYVISQYGGKSSGKDSR